MLNRGLPKARWTPVYRSEALRGGRGAYAPAVTTAGELWKGQAAAPARVEWWVERRGIDPKLLGFVQLTAARVAAAAAAAAVAGRQPRGAAAGAGLLLQRAVDRWGRGCGSPWAVVVLATAAVDGARDLLATAGVKGAAVVPAAADDRGGEILSTTAVKGEGVFPATTAGVEGAAVVPATAVARARGVPATAAVDGAGVFPSTAAAGGEP